MYRKIIPTLIIEKRGTRSRREVIEAAAGNLTEMDLYSYEKGKNKVSDGKLPYLLKGLRATFEDISEPVDLAVEA